MLVMESLILELEHQTPESHPNDFERHYLNVFIMEPILAFHQHR